MSQPIFKDGIGYEGKVTLTLKSKDRILEKKTYKNNGTVRLFTFLGYCLVDDYANAKKFLPTKIMLLHNRSESPDTENVANIEYLESRSSWQGLSQQPTIISDSGNAQQVSVVYSFEVPKSAIDSKGSFNQVALYRAEPENISDFSAFFNLLDDNSNFADQYVTDWSVSTVLLIEWELILSNKNVSQEDKV